MSTPLPAVVPRNDIYVVAASMLACIAAQKATVTFFPRISSQLKAESLKGLSLDMAMVPLKLCGLILNIPIIMRLFCAETVWGPTLSAGAGTAWLALSCGYLFEMYHLKIALHGLIHHGITMSITAWMLQDLRTATVADVVVLRSLAIDFVLSIALGGMLTTAMRAFFVIANTIDQSRSREKKLARIGTCLVWALSAAIFFSWSIQVVYSFYWSAELFARLGLSVGFIAAARFAIFFIQWHYVFAWHRKLNRRFWPVETDQGKIQSLPVQILNVTRYILMVSLGWFVLLACNHTFGVACGYYNGVADMASHFQDTGFKSIKDNVTVVSSRFASEAWDRFPQQTLTLDSHFE